MEEKKITITYNDGTDEKFAVCRKDDSGRGTFVIRNNDDNLSKVEGLTENGMEVEFASVTYEGRTYHPDKADDLADATGRKADARKLTFNTFDRRSFEMKFSGHLRRVEYRGEEHDNTPWLEKDPRRANEAFKESFPNFDSKPAGLFLWRAYPKAKAVTAEDKRGRMYVLDDRGRRVAGPFDFIGDFNGEGVAIYRNRGMYYVAKYKEGEFYGDLLGEPLVYAGIHDGPISMGERILGTTRKRRNVWICWDGSVEDSEGRASNKSYARDAGTRHEAHQQQDGAEYRGRQEAEPQMAASPEQEAERWRPEQDDRGYYWVDNEGNELLGGRRLWYCESFRDVGNGIYAAMANDWNGNFYMKPDGTELFKHNNRYPQLERLKKLNGNVIAKAYYELNSNPIFVDVDGNEFADEALTTPLHGGAAQQQPAHQQQEKRPNRGSSRQGYGRQQTQGQQHQQQGQGRTRAASGAVQGRLTRNGVSRSQAKRTMRESADEALIRSIVSEVINECLSNR